MPVFAESSAPIGSICLLKPSTLTTSSITRNFADRELLKQKIAMRAKSPLQLFKDIP
jgi:hypothetical protein